MTKDTEIIHLGDNRVLPSRQRIRLVQAVEMTPTLEMVEEVCARARAIGMLGSAKFDIAFDPIFLRDMIVIEELER